MRNIIVISLILIFHSSFGQINDKKKMEKFNISEFNKNQVAGEYNRIIEDRTEIIQFGDASGYVEKVKPLKGWFYTYKEFYGNGNLKVKGDSFKKGGFRSGIWVEFDDSARMIKQINYDEPFIINLDSLLKILKREKIPFSIEDKYNEITREVIDGKAVWYVDWRIIPNRIETVTIEDQRGIIINRDFYLINKH